MRSDPVAGYVDLATRILAGGKERLGAQAADYTDPNALADAVIDAGCRAVQAADMQAHGNRLVKGSPGSRAQSVMEKLAEHQQPEPRVAQLVRQRVHAEWLRNDARLNCLADQVLEMAEAAGEALSEDDPEVAAKRALDVARRQLSAAEGGHIEAGSDAAEVESAFETFDPPIRRHALADILMGKLRQLSMQRKLGGAAPVDASLAVQAEG